MLQLQVRELTAVALAAFVALSATPALRAFGLTMLIGESAIWLLTPYFRLASPSA